MGSTILVVEDDPSVATALQRILRRAGDTVECVGTGLDAVARVRAGGVDLVVLDLGLPDIDGHDVCRLSRAEGYTGNILVVTARHGPTESAEALGAGADDFMQKPFGINELLTHVRPLLE